MKQAFNQVTWSSLFFSPTKVLFLLVGNSSSSKYFFALRVRGALPCEVLLPLLKGMVIPAQVYPKASKRPSLNHLLDLLAHEPPFLLLSRASLGPLPMDKVLFFLLVEFSSGGVFLWGAAHGAAPIKTNAYPLFRAPELTAPPWLAHTGQGDCNQHSCTRDTFASAMGSPHLTPPKNKQYLHIHN